MSDEDAQSMCDATPDCGGYTRWYNGHALDGRVRFERVGITGTSATAQAMCYTKVSPTPAPTPATAVLAASFQKTGAQQ